MEKQEAPECPICMGPFIEPLLVGCGHAFCRVCLLQTTRLSPTGRSCPLCRADVDIKSPLEHPVDQALENRVRAALPPDVYEAKQKQATELVEEFKRQVRTELPIFYMDPGSSAGSPVRLHLFEPRYKILIRRVWESNQLFIYCAKKPKQGDKGVVVHVQQAFFLPGGLANIIGMGVQEIRLGHTWVEDGTGGLFYTRVDMEGAGLRSRLPQLMAGDSRVNDTSESVHQAIRPCSACCCGIM